jgi:glycosyltransferase involved in cell wall biosynthesis
MGGDGQGLDHGGQAPHVSPRISVVLPVFNGGDRLRETLHSLLGQGESDYELIVVDDGSTDGTASIIAEYAAADRRIRPLQQENKGITQALMRGCEAARAPLIARQDSGDVSRSERLERMIAFMDQRPGCVLAASEVAHTGPQGEVLYTTAHARRHLRDSLLHAPIGDIVGLPHHGAAVFRLEAYRRAGGYRPEFYFAQDLDLWIRMAAQGDVCVTDPVLYEARLDVAAISSLHRSEQVASARLALAIRDEPQEPARAELLRRAASIRPRPSPRSRFRDAKALYFVAACLRKRNDPRWRGYASRAIRRSPWHMPSWLLLLRSVLA